MAYNSVKERDPLIDKETQRALEHRLTELLGIVMIACACLLYTSPSPRDLSTSRMPSSA